MFKYLIYVWREHWKYSITNSNGSQQSCGSTQKMSLYLCWSERKRSTTFVVNLSNLILAFWNFTYSNLTHFYRQFLLEKLCNEENRHVIRWTGQKGQFEIRNPKLLATWWGLIKKKETMTYEKMSRAIRSKYNDGLFTKPAKIFFYQFTNKVEGMAKVNLKKLTSLKFGVKLITRKSQWSSRLILMKSVF